MEEQNLSFAYLASEPPIEAAAPPATESSVSFAWEAIRAQWTARRPSAPARSPTGHGGKNAAAKLVSGGIHWLAMLFLLAAPLGLAFACLTLVRRRDH